MTKNPGVQHIALSVCRAVHFIRLDRGRESFKLCLTNTIPQNFVCLTPPVCKNEASRVAVASSDMALTTARGRRVKTLVFFRSEIVSTQLEGQH